MRNQNFPSESVHDRQSAGRRDASIEVAPDAVLNGDLIIPQDMDLIGAIAFPRLSREPMRNPCCSAAGRGPARGWDTGRGLCGAHAQRVPPSLGLVTAPVLLIVGGTATDLESGCATRDRLTCPSDLVMVWFANHLDAPELAIPTARERTLVDRRGSRNGQSVCLCSVTTPKAQAQSVRPQHARPPRPVAVL
jgi:hypothetical protein